MSAIEDVIAERERQKSDEGWTPTHDDAHDKGQMAGAAACYAMLGLKIQNDDLRNRVANMYRDLWPWAEAWWKPKDRRRDLVRAAALLVAEIERIDRNASRHTPVFMEHGEEVPL